MKALNKLGILALSLAFLTACGDKESNTSNKTTASASSTSSISKYDEVLNALPEVDQTLTAPIIISDQKSQTAANELDKAFAIFEIPKAAKIENIVIQLRNLATPTPLPKNQIK